MNSLHIWNADCITKMERVNFKVDKYQENLNEMFS